MVDAAALSGEITPFVAAALTAYGTAVVARAEETAADASVSLGQRLLRRITGRPAVDDAVDDLAEDPDDDDARAALRVQLRKLLRDDEELAAELAAELAGHLPRATTQVTVTASGQGSVAAQHIHGNVSTGNTFPVAPPEDCPEDRPEG